MIYLNKSLSGKISIRGTAMTGYLRVTAADTIMADTIPLDPNWRHHYHHRRPGVAASVGPRGGVGVCAGRVGVCELDPEAQ
jgi:hypothetical protein